MNQLVLSLGTYFHVSQLVSEKELWDTLFVLSSRIGFVKRFPVDEEVLGLTFNVASPSSVDRLDTFSSVISFGQSDSVVTP